MAIRNWLDHNAKAIQALSAIATLLVAIAALIGVKVQIDASARLQQEQSARDIYREFLTLSIAQPKFAAPDFCAIVGTADEAAYNNYLDYLLYTSDQVLAARPDWATILSGHLGAHKEAMCGENDWSDEAPEVQHLVARFRAEHCVAFKSACPAQKGLE